MGAGVTVLTEGIPAMPVVLNYNDPDEGPSERGLFVSQADAQEWLDTVQCLIDPEGVEGGEYTIEPVTPDHDYIVLSLTIENTYELYADVTTYANNVVVPVPPGDQDSDEYQEWVHDEIIGWTGVGHTDGDSWYDVTVTASSDETVIPVGTTYDWGY